MEPPDSSEALLTIGVVAKRLGVSESTLRLYEREGLVIPKRTETGRRLYSLNDLRMMSCIRTLIRKHGLNFAGIRALFSRIHCWRIKNCTEDQRARCQRFHGGLVPCWCLEETGCGVMEDEDCSTCPVYAAASELFLPGKGE